MFPTSANFNSRPCERGDAETNGGGTDHGYFNSRPCERGDNIVVKIQAEQFGFQFTPLREGRPREVSNSCFSHFISIHAPARGATKSMLPGSLPPWYFNSRPCERGDDCGSDGPHQAGHISIHAPARGATLRDGVGYDPGKISIHAPARGATPLRPDGQRSEGISIHAPARGATRIPRHL